MYALWWAVSAVDGAEERYARTVCAAMSLLAFGNFIICIGLDGLNYRQNPIAGIATTTLRQLSSALTGVLPLAVWATYFRLGGVAQSASAYAVMATVVVSLTACTIVQNVHIFFVFGTYLYRSKLP
jgi:hypothetical protein